jgi:ribosomal protein L31
MASSITSANITNFDSDPDENYGDMAVVMVKEEALSDDESILNCDSIDDFYEFADTSLPVDVECSELVKDNVIQATNETPKHGSILVSLLADSTLKSYQQMYRDVGTTMNTVSESSLKFNLIGNKNVIEKYQHQSEVTSPLKVDRGKVVQLEPQKSQTVETQVSQPAEHQFKCLHCSKVFELKSQLELHEIGHKQFKSCSNSLSRQEVITVKEEVLSDDEVVVNDASANEYYNIEGTSLPANVQCLEIENPNSLSLGSNTSNNGLNVAEVCANSTLKNYHGICNDSKLAKLCLVPNKDGTRKHEKHTTNLGSVNVNVKNVMRQKRFKTKPKIARCYGTSVEHRFKCQECSETFELKSYLVNHEISHDHYRKYKAPPRVDYVKRSHTPNHVGSVNVNVKKVMQQQHERKTRCAPSSFAMCYLLNQSYRTNYLSSVKVNKRKVQRRLKTKPMVEPICDTTSQGHKFKCQECGATFELKSCLVMHEISHEQCRRYRSLPVLKHMKQARATYSVVGSVTVNDKKAMQQQLEMKPTTEASCETSSV